MGPYERFESDTTWGTTRNWEIEKQKLVFDGIRYRSRTRLIHLFVARDMFQNENSIT